MISRSHVAVAVVLAASSLALASCGSGSSSDTTTEAAKTVTETTQPTTATSTTSGGGSVNLTCTVSGLGNVQGGQAKVTVEGTNIDPSQADQATCSEAKVVARQATAGGAEQPVNADGFQCTPSVLSTGPDKVDWECTFKGADTATEITMSFQVTYTG